MTTAALLTAVAASPKPTAISRTLPGYSVMSPAAKTRGRLVRIAESTTTCRLSISSPHCLHRAEVGDEAERRHHGLGGSAWRLLAVDCVISTSDRCAVAAQRGDLRLGDDLDAASPAPEATVRSWARKASRRCTRVTDFATGSRCERPVEGASRRRRR